jgi:hypothetical protein
MNMFGVPKYTVNNPRGVDLGSVSFPEVMTSLHISTYLECYFAALLKPSTARVGIYPT